MYIIYKYMDVLVTFAYHWVVLFEICFYLFTFQKNIHLLVANQHFFLKHFGVLGLKADPFGCW